MRREHSASLSTVYAPGFELTYSYQTDRYHKIYLEVVILKKGIGLAGIFFAIILLLAVSIGKLNGMTQSVTYPILCKNEPVLILDAGHGGEDGGAISITGVSESQINLDIVIKLRDILASYGVNPLVLRESDLSLHDTNATTLREKKRSDLKNRVAMIRSEDNAVLLSIHQNTFPSPSCKGAQVFYAPTNGSQELADNIQKNIHCYLQPNNERIAKQIPETVYLMNHISCPGVLVECGFLTNSQEEALLLDHGYQKQLATVLASSWLMNE